MQTPSRIYAAALALTLLTAYSPAALARPASFSADPPVATAQQNSALERGYRTGYSDGYQAGYRDSVEGARRDARGKEDYRNANRVYVPAYGSLENYRDGYRQGFDSGYDSGYDRRGFDSTVPTGLRPRGVADDGAADTASRNDDVVTRPADDRPAASDPGANRPADDSSTARGSIQIPLDTTMRVELLNNLSTDVSQRGDRFEVRVVEPAEYAGMVVTGRVSSVRRPGKVRGSGQLQLTFQQIRSEDGRWANFNAQVIEVISTRTDSGVGEVDEEGGVGGRSTTKDDVTKVGAATGIGAIIGAIAGGGKGAAIGAVIGAGVGTGGVMTARGKDIRLERGQELRIRSSTDTRIQ